MKRSILLFLVLIVVSSTIPVFANNYYEKGNTFFTIKAGITNPTFAAFPKDKEEKTYFGSDINMKIGGFGSIAYQACVLPKLAIGGELGYCFNYVYKNLVTLVPITAKLSYIPVQTGKIDLNINSNIGIEFLRYSAAEYRHIVPFVSITVNPVYYINEKWGIGIDAGLGTLFEIKESPKQSAIFGYAPITISATYRR